MKVLGLSCRANLLVRIRQLTSEARGATMKLNGKKILLAGVLSLGLFLSAADASADQSDMISTASSLVGSPYAWGGTSPSGFDCSGFVKYVLNQTGIDVPHSSREMYEDLNPVSDLRTGDLVFFHTYSNGPSHVGIYVGNNEFISSTDSGVEIDSLSKYYWGSRYIGARRV
jgi:cell wall-associated NlpC family hydrolase